MQRDKTVTTDDVMRLRMSGKAFITLMKNFSTLKLPARVLGASYFFYL